MNGFFNIIKPYGITSFAVVKKIKRLLGKKTKIGHLGTLDPMATGVLPVAVGKATKLLQYIPDNRKTYRAIMTLGATSDTQDALGILSYNKNVVFYPEKLPEILHKYTGEIEQVPPMFSAVHHEGQRLYQLARQGKVVNRAARKTSIYMLQLEKTEYDENAIPHLSLYIHCSSGTYIRTLCHDIGQDLGTGAYLSSLVRTSWGDFLEQDAVTLETLETNLEKYLYRMDYPLSTLPEITVMENDKKTAILNGNFVYTDISKEHPIIKVYDQEKNLIAIAKTLSKNTATMLKPIRVLG